jgi:hypothetical protein
VVGIRSGTEEPKYRVIDTLGQVQIRQYAPRLAASVTVGGDEIAARGAGFRRLAGFIFGNNTASSEISMTAPVAQSAAKIAMTAPVAQTPNAAGWTISFYMPAQYTEATLPKPNDPGIKIVQVPAETDAVYRFSGIPGAAASAKARAILLRVLAGSAWQPVGDPFEWFYDPPWTIPWARRNEVAVAVVRK